MYEIEIDGKIRTFNECEEDKDKYLVFTCARGENDYIVEWVKHYLSYGFDKIIICDNNDDNSLEGVLSEYISNGTVEIFDFRGASSFQVQMYSVFARHGNYKWCAYFDCDEFLELNCYSNIKQFLDTVQEDCICFNWLVFGSNGLLHKKEGGVQQRFPLPTMPIVMFKENMFIKSIVRGGENNKFKNCWFNGSHLPMAGDDVIYNIGGYHLTKSKSHEHMPLRYKCGYLKHYYTKSFDEWIQKASRGWPDGTPSLSTSNYFICNRESNVPIENYVNGFFIHSFDGEFIQMGYLDLLNQYDVINVINSNQHIYPWLIHLCAMMKACKSHTFVVTDEHIDDTLFNICLEMAYKTGNRLVYARNYEEVWNTYLKYNDGRNGTYYILDIT